LAATFVTTAFLAEVTAFATFAGVAFEALPGVRALIPFALLPGILELFFLEAVLFFATFFTATFFTATFFTATFFTTALGTTAVETGVTGETGVTEENGETGNTDVTGVTGDAILLRSIGAVESAAKADSMDIAPRVKATTARATELLRIKAA
jgi:hypothetical protein